MTCKRVLLIVGCAWAALAIAGLLVFGFLDIEPWVRFGDNGARNVLRFLVLLAFFLFGVVYGYSAARRCE